MMNYFFAYGCFIICLSTVGSHADPLPGEVYREYIQNMGGNEWRVTDPDITGKFQERASRHLPNPRLTIQVDDLEHAIRAEVLIDRWGGHTNTYDHKIRFNDKAWLTVPPLSTTPAGHEPEMYHFQDNPVIPVPLDHLTEGENIFEGTCRGTWWGQWGMYSILLRIYYDPEKKDHISGKIISPLNGEVLEENPTITITMADEANVARIDLLAYYEGYDVDGDGVYQEWQQNYHQEERGAPIAINHHVGTLTEAPFQCTWNTEWIPDQERGSIKVKAHIQSKDGIWYVTQPVEQLSLRRKDTCVKLYKAYEVPEKFGVRQNREVLSCKLNIPETDISNAIEAVIHYRTWNGDDSMHDNFTINAWSHTVDGKNHHYAYCTHVVPVAALKKGENIVTFHSTTHHHSLEVLWPGPGLLIKMHKSE